MRPEERRDEMRLHVSHVRLRKERAAATDTVSAPRSSCRSSRSLHTRGPITEGRFARRMILSVNWGGNKGRPLAGVAPVYPLPRLACLELTSTRHHNPRCLSNNHLLFHPTCFSTCRTEALYTPSTAFRYVIMHECSTSGVAISRVPPLTG